MNRSRGGLLILAALALVVQACASGGSGEGGDGEPVVFQLAGEQEEVAVYEAMVTAFEKDHDGIDVRLVPLAEKDDHLTKLSTSFAAGNPPDVFLVNFREYSMFVAQGAVEPFENHLEESGLALSDYYEEPIEAFTYQGALQCMPQNISNLVVYYNRALFKEAGVSRPPGDWSWTDFREVAAKLSDGEIDGVGIEPSVIRVAPFVWSNGGDIVDDPAGPSTFTLEEPAAREAVEFVVSLARDGLMPTEKEVAAQDLETRFVTSKLGMLLSSRVETPAFREVAGLDWDVLPLPRSNEPASILHSDAYCIAAGTDRLADAVEFVSFALGQEGQTITALGGRTVPSLKKVATSGAFLDPTQAPEHAEVWLDQIPFLRTTPVIPTWPEIEDLSQEVFTRAYYEPGYTIDDALRALDQQTSVLFEEGAAP